MGEFKVGLESGKYGTLAKTQRGTLSAVAVTHWETVVSRREVIAKRSRDGKR